MRVLFLIAVVAASYCEDSWEKYGIEQENCVSIHQEYMAMLTSGKSLEVISTELKEQDEIEDDAQDSADDGPADTDMSCGHSCAQSTQACNICQGMRTQNTCCRRRKNTTRKSITYGGYVKSHVLIQCYGMIDEGCRRLPTWHSGCYKVCGGCSDSCNTASCGCATTCQATNSSCGCMASAQNFQRYLHCVGRRVSRCYRTKIIHTRQVCHAAPTTWGGCTYKWCVPCSQCGTNTSCQSTCSNTCNTGMPHLV